MEPKQHDAIGWQSTKQATDTRLTRQHVHRELVLQPEEKCRTFEDFANS